MTHPALISDDLDDLRGVDLFAPTQLEVECQLGATIFAMGSDELRALDPALWLLRGQFIAQMNAAFAKGASLTGAYQAAPGAANAMDSDLHATGVI